MNFVRRHQAKIVFCGGGGSSGGSSGRSSGGSNGNATVTKAKTEVRQYTTMGKDGKGITTTCVINTNDKTGSVKVTCTGPYKVTTI
jgi:hypothetical protein